MPNVMRWRYGDTSPVLLPVKPDLLIEVGDLLFMCPVDGSAKPASTLKIGTQENLIDFFVKHFAGVAMQGSRINEANKLRVSTTGCFEYDCPKTIWQVGDHASPRFASSLNELENQLVSRAVQGATQPNSIGRCTKRVDPASKKVLIEIISSITERTLAS